PNVKDATVDTLRDRIKEQMVAGEKATYYREDLKPKFIENLVKNINFALPKTVVEQEINFALNNKIRSFTEEQINELKEDASKIEKIREELKEDAVNSVKATFIVDALAKAEKVEVNDQEVTQILYFEALQMGQNPQELIKQYQQAGYLPAIKMSMIEEKVLAKLFDEKAK
ncbi:MAG: trigger factor, partial [Arcobacter skirrowii]|nr:trigger factor [Aliarcobacter skirrowii]